MRNLFRQLRKKRFAYEPLVEVRISKDALLYNLNVFASCAPQWGIAPVLKANAYGHGLVDVARILEDKPEISFFVVDSYYEALVLRNEGLRTPILVIGYTLTNNILESTLSDVAFTVGSITQLRELVEKKVRQALHLKIDTGMHRQGIALSDVPSALDLVLKNRSVRIEGVCSHFADADGEDDAFTREQIRQWNEFTKTWRTRIPDTKYYHISHTAGMRFVKEISANVGRLGIGLYGIASGTNLKPALEMKTRVTALRLVPKGETVGYNNTWTAKHDTLVATIPVGYYEGVDRRLSNKGFVQVKGSMCPIVGRVSMNMTTVDVTDVTDVQEGGEAIVMSIHPEDKNSIMNMAQTCNTIPYDILVHIPSTLRRVMI
ncbi:MAG: alanine racemase [Candidatus Campbellbacteria bacterium]|nr:alanine racemase [Candidatus Campbellbacteria bacterium]